MEAVLISRLQDIINHIEKITKECEELNLKNEFVVIEKKQAEIACKKLEALHSRFSTELNNYFRMSSDPSADDISRFSNIQLHSEEVFMELTTKLKSANEDLLNKRSGDSVIARKLPKLNLPEFKGDILEWQQFWDHFSSNIDSRNLPDVDKLLYLKSSVTGDARRAIEGLETTSKNYQIAVLTLKERYGRESQIIDAHYAALYKVKAADKTAEDCRRVLNEIERHIRVLNSLGENTDHNHLRFIIIEKFPEDVIYEMKISLKTDSIEDMRKQLDIIVSAREEACRIAQQKSQNNTQHYTVETFHGRDNVSRQIPSNLSKNKFQGAFSKNQRKPFYNTSRMPHSSNQNQDTYRGFQNKRRFEDSNNKSEAKRRKVNNCIFCQGHHYNDLCQLVKSIKERKAKLKNRCYICFNLGHQSTSCNKRKACAHCGNFGKHNRALCPKLDTFVKKDPKSIHTHTMSTMSTSLTVLQTAVVYATNEEESNLTSCRVLMDSGSQRSYITLQVADKLKLPKIEEHHLSVFTFGTDKPQEYDSPLVKLQILTQTNEKISIFANVVPSITQQVYYPEQELSHLKNDFLLADDGSLGDRIDVLIGNDYYFTIIDTEKKQINENLFLVNSKFGWMLTGKSDINVVDNLSLSAVTYFQSNGETKLNKPDLPLDNLNLKNLWDLECIGITDSPNTTKEEEAISKFNESINYINKRYTVSWPWKETISSLPSNLGLARGRLVNLLKRMDKETLSLYDDTIRNQLEKGIIEVIPAKELNHSEHQIHYLPHHGVKTPGKSIRIVYDASAKLKDGISLNECLRAGPILLEDLIALLIRFRSHKIGLTADVEKAFLQIGLQNDSKDVTRFLWIKDISKAATDDNILHLRFCRVPFGIISSPFLLNATIKHHLMQVKDQGVKQAAGDIYVDNLVTGTKTRLQAMTLYNSIKREFGKMAMNLREWSSNSKEIIDNITDVNDAKVVKVLGLNWDTEDDKLQLRTKKVDLQTTKRGVLRTIASIYDPCGYAVPSLLSSKLFMQELWKSKIKWDSPLPTEMLTKWKELHTQLCSCQEAVPRYYTEDFENKENQLHCFADASTKAYSAVVYVVNENGKAFVIGKSRLTPIKDQDNLKIPRLELLGVLIGSRLLKYVETSLQIKIKQHFLWTDSQIVIDWYNSDKLLTPFVARRIEEIKQNKNLTLRYVPTELNPADVGTRPNLTQQEKEYWLKGPQFLEQNPKNWPIRSNLIKEHSLNFLTPEGPSKWSNCLTDVQQDIRYIKEVNEKNDTKVSADKSEIQTQEEIKRLQAQHYPDEVEMKTTSLGRNLRLFKDDEGILRCKGRFENTQWSYDMKYPILLPKNCEFTNNLIKKVHQENYHVGVNHTLSLLRKQYWIPQGKAQVQRILRQCPSCVKHGGGPFKLPPTPSLPTERVNYSSPFTFTGLDYLGPVLVKTERGTAKRWICLFTCLAVRAIHLEIVQDCTAEEGLLALRRMTSTRGTPKLITSDNASQFKLISEILTDPYCRQREIRWKFIPQLAPWFGGFYERLVGLVKHCMKRTLHKHLLNESQLLTVVKEIEAILNTRPLTCVDSEIVHILTPADFLNIGKCLTMETIPNEDVPLEGTTTKVDLIKGWKRALVILNEFKEMFSNCYLPSLRERYVNSAKQLRVKSQETPKEGQIVQIKGDSKNREEWKVGKIVSLIKGGDGFIRVAKVKVGDKEYTRSIAQLYPLEITDVNAGHQSELISHIPEETRHIQSVVTPETMEIPNEEVMNIEDSGEVDTRVLRTPKSSDVTINQNNEKRELYEIQTVNEPQNTQDKRPVRAAATRALEKIQEWTRSLINLL